MPISDPEGYVDGHFRRVYEHVIVPACTAAGFRPIRADDVNQTNLIVADILKRVVKSNIVLCDLSSRNPNVLFELGIRQAFNKPVTLICDTRTPRIFDIGVLRTVSYSEDLRVDNVESNRKAISEALRLTALLRPGETNSLIDLLDVQVPKPAREIEISASESIILSYLRDIADRIDSLGRSLEAPRLGASFDDVMREFEERRKREVRIARLEYELDTKFLERERALVQYASDGLSDEAIADYFGVTSERITAILAKLADKLGVKTRDELIEHARQIGLVTHETRPI